MACGAGSVKGEVMDEEVIPIFRVANAAAALAWYERLGFSKEWEHRFDPDCPAFVSIARGRMRLFLSEHRGDARPGTLVGLFVNDIGTVVAEFGRPEEGGSSGALPMATGEHSRERRGWASSYSIKYV